MLKNLWSNAAGFGRKFPIREIGEGDSVYAGTDLVSKRVSGIWAEIIVTLGRDLGSDPYLRQGALSIMKKLPESFDIRCTGHVHSHSNDSNRFHDRRDMFGDGDHVPVGRGNGKRIGRAT